MVVSLKRFNYNKQNAFVLAGNKPLPTRVCVIPHTPHPPSLPPSKKQENVTSHT